MEPGVKERMTMGLLGCLAAAVLVATLDSASDGTAAPSMMGIMASFDGSEASRTPPPGTAPPIPVLAAMRAGPMDTSGPRCLVDVSALSKAPGSAMVDAQQGAYAVHVSWTGGPTSLLPDQDCSGSQGFLMGASAFYTLKSFGRAVPSRKTSPNTPVPVSASVQPPPSSVSGNPQAQP